MTLTDAILILMLADRLHGTDAAIRRVGKNLVKKLPRAKREIIYNLINSPSSSKLIHHIATHLDD